MRLIDTHCHLYLPEFASDLEELIQRAENEGVEKFYLPAIDSSSREALVSLEEKFPGKCFAMEGLHPCSVKANYREELDRVKASLDQRKFVAIGEIGLDLYWDRTFETQQYEAFSMQVDWALARNLPIVIHSRSAMQECIDMVRSKQNGSLRGIFHCFGESLEMANQITALGFYLGIGGVITYKKSVLPQVLAHIDPEYLVLETDAPYLSPVPFRGKRNESAYLKYVLAKLAEVKGMQADELAEITTRNAIKIFGG